MTVVDRTHLTRRAAISGALALAASAHAPATAALTLIEAPTNLGLKPLRPGHVPGAGGAPAALRRAGLHDALKPARVVSLAPPIYRDAEEPGSRIRNASGIRAFSTELAAAVSTELKSNQFPVVVGGDCSILLGSLLGARAVRQIGLVHIDGHSDFYHPGNYDTASRLGSVAGMDLALATGRGEPILAAWEGRALIEDRHVVQIGERDELEPDYDYWDINDTAIRRLPVRAVLSQGMASTVRQALEHGDPARRLWVHVDLDVLDRKVMPAVDSPGSPGLGYDDLSALLGGLLRSGRVIGLNVAIYDPDLDPDGRYAAGIVACLTRALWQRR